MLAPAKTNLYLEVLGQRNDGFHELETVFACLDWGDDLTLTTQPGSGCTALTVDGPLADGVPWPISPGQQPIGGVQPVVW